MLHTHRPISATRQPWKKSQGLGQVLHDWRNNPRLANHFVLDHIQPATEASYAPLPGNIASPIQAALASYGIDNVYAHQAQAIALGLQYRDVVIATPTASGKSLCYNVPVVNEILRSPSACALYLFPTKALSRDQEEHLRCFMKDCKVNQSAITFDGDTPADARRAAREQSGVILTNPDMLHAGMLPHHTRWARFFANLKYVVIDELHTYRGVFGSHLANVLRRLHRIAQFHGSSPTFMFASATIGNPKEHASAMLGRPVALIDQNSAPTNTRHVLAYNPPIVHAELGIRQSYVKASVRLASDLVRAGVSTLIFGQSRNNVEVMLKYLRDRLRNDLDPNTAIVGYRGGYLPSMRRRIEAGLRAGDVACVVATNALELGIDIGSLDAVICAGYPGSIASLWQRFGRGGRRNTQSLALLVTSSAPTDQFFAQSPEVLIGAPVEQARIDPDNLEILVQHLKCASFELPIDAAESFGNVPPSDVGEAMDYLADNQLVHKVPHHDGRHVYHWRSESYPANSVSLRNSGWDNFVIINTANNETIAEMDWRSTHKLLHEQAIYQQDGRQYQVERLDFDNHKAFVRAVMPDYFTSAMSHIQVTPLCESERMGVGQVTAGLGEVSIVEKVVGYKKIRFHTHENVGYGEVHLPQMEMHTMAAWFTFPSDLIDTLPEQRSVVIDALRGLAQAMHTIATILLMVDPRDLGHTLGDQDDPEGVPHKVDRHAPRFDPSIFLYDQTPGGVGLASRIFDDRVRIFHHARTLINNCPCDTGCPACINPQTTSLDNGTPRKMLIGHILDAAKIKTCP